MHCTGLKVGDPCTSKPCATATLVQVLPLFGTDALHWAKSSIPNEVIMLFAKKKKDDVIMNDDREIDYCMRYTN